MFNEEELTTVYYSLYSSWKNLISRPHSMYERDQLYWMLKKTMMILDVSDASGEIAEHFFDRVKNRNN